MRTNVKWGLAAIAVTAAVTLAGCAAGEPTPPAGLLAMNDPGEHSLTVSLTEALAPLEPAVLDALTADPSLQWVQLAGGSTDYFAETLTSLGEQSAQIAEVLAVPIESLGAYIAGLTPVRTGHDLLLTNHELRDNTLQPRASVLQAGTAILIDDAGTPRVRLTSSTPLTSPADSAINAVEGERWDGFTIDSIRTGPAESGPAPILGLDGQPRTRLVGGDPCVPFHEEGQNCRIEAYVDVTGDGYANAIGITPATGPSVTISVDLGATIASYTPGVGDIGGQLVGLGPQEPPNRFFTGAFDITGDGVPELVLQTSGTEAQSLYEVLEIRDGQIHSIRSPYQGGDFVDDVRWGGSAGVQRFHYRCTAEPEAPLEVTVLSGDRKVVGSLARSGPDADWVGVGDSVDVYLSDEDLGLPQFDCENRAVNAQPDEDSGPPAAPTPAQSSCAVDDGRATATVTAGDVSCPEMDSLWAEAVAQRNAGTFGQANIIPVGDWTCTPSRGKAVAQGRCSQQSGSAQFTVTAS